MGSFFAFLVIIALLGIIVWLLLRADGIRVPEFITKRIVVLPPYSTRPYYGRHGRHGRRDHGWHH